MAGEAGDSSIEETIVLDERRELVSPRVYIDAYVPPRRLHENYLKYDNASKRDHAEGQKDHDKHDYRQRIYLEYDGLKLVLGRSDHRAVNLRTFLDTVVEPVRRRCLLHVIFQLVNRLESLSERFEKCTCKGSEHEGHNVPAKTTSEAYYDYGKQQVADEDNNAKELKSTKHF